MALAFEKANSVHVEVLDLTRVHKSAAEQQKHGQNLLRYLMYGSKLKQLEAEHNVQIAVPRGPIAEQKPVLEFVAKEEDAVEKACNSVNELAKSLPPHYFDYATVEPHFHRHIIGRKGQNIQRLSEALNVSIITPDEKEDSSEILLVFEGKASELEGLDQMAKDAKIKEGLATAAAELTKMAADISDFTSKTIKVPAKYHGAIIGPKRTTLNAILGSSTDSQVFVKFGSAAPSGDKPRNTELAEDAIVIRGPTEEVNRVISEINRVHEEAKHEDFLNSHVAECVIPAEYSAHVIGKAGSNINKLKDDLGVKIDIEDGKANREASAANTKGAAKNEKVKVTIKGIKVNVEAAKERIMALVDSLADRTVTSLNIPRQYHKSLIGSSGRYVKKLEDKYSVRIQFPRSDISADASDDGSEESSLADKASSDEITLSGGKKGVASAKAELLELYEYEVENSKVETFTFDGKHLPHVVGRNGAKVKEIKDETQAKIDFSKPVDGVVTTTLQGTKESIAKAKELILELITELDSQVTETIKIKSVHHKRLIGAGGRNIRNIVVDAGGPADRAATMVRFPRAEDNVQDEIVLKGDKEIVAKIRAKLEQLVAEEEAQVTVTVDVPRDEHANLIGRGGSNLKALQKKYNVRIDFPKAGNASAGEAVTIVGLPDDCEKCKTDMLVSERITHIKWNIWLDTNIQCFVN
jgi:predicted PilT family ATPase